ncbi:unnamed protein product [Effrenium voratum]|nr:unnamed protein product [Effrenium voratum]
MHLHPGRERGYPNPVKRSGKVRKLPNVRLKRYDYSVTASKDGQFYLQPPYPPRINRTVQALAKPRSRAKARLAVGNGPKDPKRPPWGAKKNPWPTTVHKDYKLKWRNIEYVFVPELTRKPHGSPSRRWAGPVKRIELLKGRKPKVTWETHAPGWIWWGWRGGSGVGWGSRATATSPNPRGVNMFFGDVLHLP